MLRVGHTDWTHIGWLINGISQFFFSVASSFCTAPKSSAVSIILPPPDDCRDGPFRKSLNQVPRLEASHVPQTDFLDLQQHVAVLQTTLLCCSTSQTQKLLIICCWYLSQYYYNWFQYLCLGIRFITLENKAQKDFQYNANIKVIHKMGYL